MYNPFLLILEQIAQFLHRKTHAGFDRAKRLAQVFGDLGLGIAFEIRQEQHLTLLGRQGAKRAADALAAQGVFRGLGRTIARRGSLRRLLLQGTGILLGPRRPPAPNALSVNRKRG